MAYHLTPEQTAWAVQQYLKGRTARDIGADLGMSYQALQRRLQKEGVKLRGRGPTSTGRQKLSEYRRAPIDDEQLMSMHLQGMSTAEIGAALTPPVSSEAVRRRMKTLGLARLPAKARPERNAFWAGGMTVDTDGYILVKCPDHPHKDHNGYVRQHRLVMEDSLGRYLIPGEVVDHKNGDTSDNRLDNLRLFPSNGAHLRATRTGMAKLDPQERRTLKEQAVLRARRRVAAILAESGSGAGRSQ